MLVQIAAIRDDVIWRRTWLEERCLCVCFLPCRDLTPYCAEMSQHFLDCAVEVSEVILVEILGVLFVDAGDKSLTANISDCLLYHVRLLALFF